MQRKQQALASFIKIVTCAALLLAAATQTQAADKKEKDDPTGTWSWPARRADQPNIAKLKLEGEKVTGTIVFPGQGGQTSESKIEDGKLTGNEISFKVTRETRGIKYIYYYSGKVSAETIKGKTESGQIGGPARDWEAKRQVEKK